jgi:ribonuclease D
MDKKMHKKRWTSRANSDTIPHMLITKPNELQEICRAAQAAGSIALDTEFVWQRTFLPCLGIVQLALPDGQVFLIDAVALPGLDGLGPVLADPKVELILHDALQDLQILSRHTKTLPCNVFDTRRATGFAAMEATLSLARLLQTFLQIDLAKDETRSDWLQRPLTETQAQYARDDVLHLHELARLIKDAVKNRGNTTALQEEMRRYDQPAQYDSANVETLYRRINTARFPHETRAAIFALLQWREQEAIQRDRPRGHILKDPDLMQIAISLTAQPPAQAFIPKRYAADIHEAIRNAAGATPDMLPGEEPSARLSGAMKKKIEDRRTLVQKLATDAGIDPALVANKADITTLVLHEHGLASPPPAHLTDGWRRAFTTPSTATPRIMELDFTQ